MRVTWLLSCSQDLNVFTLWSNNYPKEALTESVSLRLGRAGAFLEEVTWELNRGKVVRKGGEEAYMQPGGSGEDPVMKGMGRRLGGGCGVGPEGLHSGVRELILFPPWATGSSVWRRAEGHWGGAV